MKRKINFDIKNGDCEYFNTDNKYFKSESFSKCPHCKKLLTINIPTIKEQNRKSLSKCYRCKKDIVVTVNVISVIVNFDTTIKKVI